jgi:hypothetical protein
MKYNVTVEAVQLTKTGFSERPDWLFDLLYTRQIEYNYETENHVLMDTPLDSIDDGVDIAEGDWVIWYPESGAYAVMTDIDFKETGYKKVVDLPKIIESPPQTLQPSMREFSKIEPLKQPIPSRPEIRCGATPPAGHSDRHC